MPRIYVVEDDESIRELVIYALKTADFETLGFENGALLYEELDKKLPSLILLDIMLPNENGLEILSKLKKNDKTKDIPVIMLTAKGEEYDKVKGLDAGADDYVTKPFGVLELLSRVRAVLRRTSKPIDEVLSFGGITLDSERHIVTVDEETISLTYKEFLLLECLINNQRIVLTRDKIMERVWGFDYEGETRTVDMHIKTLRQKLGKSGENIKTVRGIGYKMGE